jgi:hypothetical protein
MLLCPRVLLTVDTCGSRIRMAMVSPTSLLPLSSLSDDLSRAPLSMFILLSFPHGLKLG